MHGMLVFVVVLCLLAVSTATDSERRFELHKPVPIVANTVGPFNNPTETYPYYSLPFCMHNGKQRRHKQDLGEVLSGARKHSTPYELTFMDPVPWRALCEDYLDVEEIKQFKDAIESDYFFEMFLLLGQSIQGARNQIVMANVTTDTKRKIDITDATAGQEIVFSYSVEWVHTPTTTYEHRMKRYADGSSFVPTSFEIHWLSIINSFVLVLLLTAFLVIILMRILKKDFSRYLDVDEEELAEEETGWKMLHGDVFRAPSGVSMLSAVLGAGTQILFTSFLLLCCVLAGVFKATKRGSVLTACIILYAICGVVGGLVAGRVFKQMKGKNWVWNTILTACTFPVPLLAVFMVVNTIAATHDSTAALPFTTILIVLAILLFVHLPLTVVGAILGRNISEEYKAPCRTNKAVREIPAPQMWYQQPVAQIFMAGFLPFSAIYIELHYIFAAIWGHKIYTLFGILLLAFIMLVIVSAFITVALAYFQLAREDHRWWWSAVFNGGATGLFIFAYSFYYLEYRSNMSGLLQLSFYFGYTGIVSYAFFLMLGSVGYFSAFAFVNKIYSAVKSD
eukprot:GSChrysophyteH2.ASY1.ANO1.1456.1 assembled CDS